jgi:hypothetical protein
MSQRLPVFPMKSIGTRESRTSRRGEWRSAFGLTGKKGAQARVPVPLKGEREIFGCASAVTQERDEN